MNVVNPWYQNQAGAMLSFCVTMALVAAQPGMSQTELPGVERPAVAGKTSRSQTNGSAGVTEAGGDQAAALFIKRCAGCHTIGRGNLVGPDLKETIDWTLPEVQKNVKRMETLVGPLPAGEVEMLSEFLRDPSAGDRLQKKGEENVPAAQLSAHPASADRGARFFEGSERFANGGVACIACHSINERGGTLGSDLTEAYEKLRQSALLSSIENPPYPIMKIIYTKSPVTRQEALHLAEFLRSVKRDHSAAGDPPIVALGLTGAILGFLALVLGLRRRGPAARWRLRRR